jgi:hypothetical protein
MSETKQLLNSAVKAEPDIALAAGGASRPTIVSGRSEAATNSRPISAPATPADATKKSCSDGGVTALPSMAAGPRPRRHGVGESARDGHGLKLVREDHARNLGKR